MFVGHRRQRAEGAAGIDRDDRVQSREDIGGGEPHRPVGGRRPLVPDGDLSGFYHLQSVCIRGKNCLCLTLR